MTGGSTRGTTIRPARAPKLALTVTPKALIARLRALSPGGRDLLAAVVLGVEMQLEVLLLVGGDQLAAHALVLALAACLALRRRYPFVTFVVSLVPFVALQVLGRDVN